MMAKLVCASAILAAAGAANAAVFGVNTVDAGGVVGGSLGNPITWTGGAAFNPGTGSNTPPSPNAIFGSPNQSLQFDSYLAIDPIGPSTSSSSSSSTDGYQALGPGNIISPTSPTSVFQNDRVTGIWFNAAAGGGFVNSGPGDRLFIAQITLRSASAGTLLTDGVLVNIKDAGTANPNGTLGALKFGLANATTNGGAWGQAYYLDFVARPVTNVNATFNGGTSYAIYVVGVVPTPGAAGIAGVAGLVALRRRRA